MIIHDNILNMENVLKHEKNKSYNYFTCIDASRDMPELAREVEGVEGGRFILLVSFYYFLYDRHKNTLKRVFHH